MIGKPLPWCRGTTFVLESVYLEEKKKRDEESQERLEKTRRDIAKDLNKGFEKLENKTSGEINKIQNSIQKIESKHTKMTSALENIEQEQKEQKEPTAPKEPKYPNEQETAISLMV